MASVHPAGSRRHEVAGFARNRFRRRVIPFMAIPFLEIPFLAIPFLDSAGYERDSNFDDGRSTRSPGRKHRGVKLAARFDRSAVAAAFPCNHARPHPPLTEQPGVVWSIIRLIVGLA